MYVQTHILHVTWDFRYLTRGVYKDNIKLENGGTVFFKTKLKISQDLLL